MSMKPLIGIRYAADCELAPIPEMGGMVGFFAYPTGCMKRLLHAAEAELVMPGGGNGK